MAYFLQAVTLRTNNTETGLQQIQELWSDIFQNNIPLFSNDSNRRQETILITKYDHYENKEHGEYDVTIMNEDSSFIEMLEQGVTQGIYQKFEAIDSSNDVGTCTKQAWTKVWSSTCQRQYIQDYEVSVPAEYALDGKAYCCLYISIL